MFKEEMIGRMKEVSYLKIFQKLMNILKRN